MTSASSLVYNGRYELVRQVARGGMAEVYLARDLLLDRPVALKALFPELSTDRSFVERFRREAQAAANLSHPNIVSVYDWGEADRTYFIVMEYVDGNPLSTVIRSQGPLAGERAATIAAEAASALAFAHRHGVVHRDVKPGNILITEDGDVKVADFGIARALGTTDEALTQTGAIMGTATYLSPEQAEGRGVDARSDVYSLGVVLYEMVTGAAPFAGDSPLAIAYKHVREQPRLPRQANPAVSPELEAVIMQAMAKDPASRYQSAEELRDDLQRFRQGRPVMAGAPTLAAAGAARAQAAYGAATQALAIDGASDATMVGGRPPAPQRRDQHTGRYIALLLILLVILGAGLYFLLSGNSLLGIGNGSAKVAVPSVIGETEGQAVSTLKGDGLKVKVDHVANGGTAGTVFGQNPHAGTSAAKGSTVTIDVTESQASVAVPNVVGRSAAYASQLLQNDGFSVKDVGAQSSQSVGTVTSQSPQAGAHRPKGSTVTLTVSTGPGKVAVPDVTGDSESEAANVLGQHGLSLGNVTTQPSSTVPSGDVISTSPAPGTKVAPNSAVNLTVSSGPAQADVPDVVGDTASSAQATLSADGFSVSEQYQTVANPNEDGVVIAQSPQGGTSEPQGATVTITVGQTLPGGSTTTTSTPSSTSTTGAGSSGPAKLG